MTTPATAWTVVASARVYGWLLWAYPPSFRRRYGPEMAQLFRTTCRAAHRQHGAVGVVRIWLPVLIDWELNVLAEHRAASARQGVTIMRWIMDARNPAARQGWLSGLLFGLVHIGYGLINNLGDLDVAANALLNNVMMVALVVLFGLAGWRGARATGRARTGVQAGLLTWVVSSAIGIASLWIITFAFMETIRHNTFMLEDFARSGTRDMDRFIVEDALGASMFGSALMLAVGIVCGAVGAVLGKRLGRPTVGP